MKNPAADIDGKPSATATRVANNKEEKTNQDRDDEVDFIKVKSKKKKKKKNNQQQKIDTEHKNNVERMKRVSLLLQETMDKKSDELGYKGQVDHYDARNKTNKKEERTKIKAKKRMTTNNKARNNDASNKHERESESGLEEEALESRGQVWIGTR
jgi:hypothetical protein